MQLIDYFENKLPGKLEAKAHLDKEQEILGLKSRDFSSKGETYQYESLKRKESNKSYQEKLSQYSIEGPFSFSYEGFI